MNTSTCAAVAPALPVRRLARFSRGGVAPLRGGLGLVAAALLGLGACGGASSPSASSLVKDSFSSHRPISSGRVDMLLALTPRAGGAVRARSSFSLHFAGSFQGAGAARLPRLALALRLTGGGRTREAGAVSTGGRLYLSLAGATYLAPDAAMAALEQGYAQGRGGSVAGSGMPRLATLGVEPGAWLTAPSLAGHANVAGADTVHVLAGLDAARFLTDAARLSSAGEALTGGRAGTPLSASLASSVRSARVDLYTGARDHVLRRLTLTAAISGAPAARTARGAPVEETLAFDLKFAQLNVPQAIAQPPRALPPAALASALERLGSGRGLAPR